jgi:preprotein translocase subunit SecA
VLDQEERRMVLVAIDKQWQEHLYNMDALREGVGLRAQGQKDPLIEYKNEAYNLFVTLMDSIKQEALQNLFRSAANLEAFLKQLHSRRSNSTAARKPSPATTRRHLRQLRHI